MKVPCSKNGVKTSEEGAHVPVDERPVSRSQDDLPHTRCNSNFAYQAGSVSANKRGVAKETYPKLCAAHETRGQLVVDMNELTRSNLMSKKGHIHPISNPEVGFWVWRVT